MNHEQHPPTPSPDDQPPAAELAPASSAATGDSTDLLPDSEQHEEQQQAVPPPQIDLDWISAVAKGIAQHGPAFAAWADVLEGRELLPGFEEAYLGEYDSLEAYAEQLIHELGYDDLLDRVVPPSLRPYVDINIAGYAQDMWLNGEVQVYHRSGGGVWIFNGN